MAAEPDLGLMPAESEFASNQIEYTDVEELPLGIKALIGVGGLIGIYLLFALIFF